jgi:hypothetical protein
MEISFSWPARLIDEHLDRAFPIRRDNQRLLPHFAEGNADADVS